MRTDSSGIFDMRSEGGVTISIADPHAMFSLVHNPRLAPVVEDTDQRLRRVIASLD